MSAPKLHAATAAERVDPGSSSPTRAAADDRVTTRATVRASTVDSPEATALVHPEVAPAGSPLGAGSAGAPAIATPPVAGASAATGASSAAPERLWVHARGEDVPAPVDLIEALDLRPSAPAPSRRVVAETGERAEERGASRPRVRARRGDDPRASAPRVHVHAGEIVEVAAEREREAGRARPRVRAQTLAPESAPGRLDHTPSQAVVVARAAAAVGQGETPTSAQTTRGDAPANPGAPVAPTPPAIDVDALVDTVKRRLAREIRWERELRRAIG